MTDHAESSPAGYTPESDPGSAVPPHGTISTWRWALANFEEIVTAVLLAVMIGSVGLGVFCRYILQSPLSWTEEVVLLCMVWVVFLGASIATKHQEHIVIDILLTVVPQKLARPLETLALSVVMAVLALLVWQGILLVEATQDVATTALGIPTMYIYAAVPTAALLMFIHSCRQLASMLRYRSGGG